MVFISRYISPLGGITLASDGETLTGLWFDGRNTLGTPCRMRIARRNARYSGWQSAGWTHISPDSSRTSRRRSPCGDRRSGWRYGSS